MSSSSIVVLVKDHVTGDLVEYEGVDSFKVAKNLAANIYDAIMSDPNIYDKVAHAAFPNIVDIPGMPSKPCRGCGTPLIVIYVQIRSSDEPPTKVYECRKCDIKNPGAGGDDD